MMNKGNALVLVDVVNLIFRMRAVPPYKGESYIKELILNGELSISIALETLCESLMHAYFNNNKESIFFYLVVDSRKLRLTRSSEYSWLVTKGKNKRLDGVSITIWFVGNADNFIIRETENEFSTHTRKIVLSFDQEVRRSALFNGAEVCEPFTKDGTGFLEDYLDVASVIGRLEREGGIYLFLPQPPRKQVSRNRNVKYRKSMG